MFRRITSKHDGYFYCLNFLYSFITENRLKEHEDVCKDHDYCYLEMPNENNKISKCNTGKKSMKVSFIFNADLESWPKKISTCHNNPNKSSTTKKNKHTASAYSLFTHCSFDATKNSLDYYRGQDCMEKFLQGFKRTCNKNNQLRKNMK